MNFVPNARQTRDHMIRLLIACTAEERAFVLRGMTGPHKREWLNRWWFWAHEGQIAPEGDWGVWLIQGGRGFGKTRAGAEYVSQIARDHPGARIALVGATAEDVRRVMVCGTSGLLAVARPGEEVVWKPSTGEVIFPGGAVAQVFSAAAAEKLRGPEHDFAWCDELAKWAPGDAWDNLRLTMRGREDARIVVTTTPRPVPLLRRILKMTGVVVTRGRSADNPHLPETFIEAMTDAYAGTRLGRQELDGELIDEIEGALWTRDLLEARRVRKPPALVRVVVGVDPPASATGDACGIVAVGLGRDGRAYVLEDASVAGASPERWARAVAACAARHGADRVVAEKNMGGDMVAATLLAANDGLPVELVSASRGKSARAEPVSLLYEAGRARHAGRFAALEDELCGLAMGGGYHGPGRSPDRADALVWAMSALMLGKRGEARVRGL